MRSHGLYGRVTTISTCGQTFTLLIAHAEHRTNHFLLLLQSEFHWGSLCRILRRVSTTWDRRCKVLLALLAGKDLFTNELCS